jgi:Ala-tRNA(Pro) deacylase
MAIAAKLKTFLTEHEADYSLQRHPHTGSSMESAEAAHVPGDCLAKGVVLKDDKGYLLVVVPSDYHVDLESLNKKLGRTMEMAPEEAFGQLFPDCEVGAIPPIGAAYGVPTIWDTTLGDKDEVYFEAGDHESLVRVTGRHFHELMASADRGVFSSHI